VVVVGRGRRVEESCRDGEERGRMWERDGGHKEVIKDSFNFHQPLNSQSLSICCHHITTCSGLNLFDIHEYQQKNGMVR
jgi:hypothetical protein